MASDQTSIGAESRDLLSGQMTEIGRRAAAEVAKLARDIVGTDSERSELAAELEAWWHTQAQEEVERVVPKAIEYGGVGSAVDLVWMGRELAGMIGRPVDDPEAIELGIWVYILGKVARWKAAILEGRRVSDDTLHDISVYCRMAQRNREVGGWPYANKEQA